MSTPTPDVLRRALVASESSVRLQAALAAGTHPDPDLVGDLVARCAVEPDFFVRDMLTWALTRLPADLTVPLLLAETASVFPQARSQALHTLSKVGDPRGWTVITPELLRDAEDDVARAAWRTAAVLVPAGAERWLAGQLATQLGRGDREVRLSLSRALVTLGEHAAAVLAGAAAHGSAQVSAHARATRRLATDGEPGFDAVLDQAR